MEYDYPSDPDCDATKKPSPYLVPVETSPTDCPKLASNDYELMAFHHIVLLMMTQECQFHQMIMKIITLIQDIRKKLYMLVLRVKSFVSSLQTL